MTRQIIKVRPCGLRRHHGQLSFGPHRSRCALGRSGILADKHEGDGGTPVGQFLLRRIWFRPDRLQRPAAALPIIEIDRKSGWCDAPDHAAYNRPVRLPFIAGHEKLWRQDGLYDVFVELGHNDDPPQSGAGSAVFLHLQKGNFQATKGCVAVSFASMDFILAHARPGCVIDIAERG